MKLVRLITMALLCFGSLTMVAQSVRDEYEKIKNNPEHFSFSATYPEEARDAEIEGTINFTFDIDSACNFTHIKADTALGFGCDEFAMKYLKHYELLIKRKSNYKCEPKIDESLPCVFRLY